MNVKPIVIGLGLAIATAGLAQAGDKAGMDAADHDKKAHHAQPADRQLTNATAADLEGMVVTNAQGKELGDVDNVLIDSATRERVAIIGLKGIVGDGAKEVAVPLSELTLSPNRDRLQAALTREELELRPDYDPGSDQYEEIEYEEAE